MAVGMKTIWQFSHDRDGDRPYYGIVMAETEEKAKEKFEQILGRPFNHWEHIEPDEVMETDQEIAKAAAQHAQWEREWVEKKRLENEEYQRKRHVEDLLETLGKKLTVSELEKLLSGEGKQ